MNKQLSLNLFKGKHGGHRPNSGRRRVKSRGVAHSTRETVTARTPVHINFKYRINIRSKEVLKLLAKAMAKAQTHGLKVVHYSLQSNHVHLIAEANDNKTLTKGMRSISITLAKGIGRGSIQLERYHLHVLKTLQETKNAVHYVLFNEQKHGSKVISSYSSLLCLKEGMRLIKDFTTKMKTTLRSEAIRS
jgi:putative transposase